MELLIGAMRCIHIVHDALESAVIAREQRHQTAKKDRAALADEQEHQIDEEQDYWRQEARESERWRRAPDEHELQRAAENRALEERLQALRAEARRLDQAAAARAELAASVVLEAVFGRNNGSVISIKGGGGYSLTPSALQARGRKVHFEAQQCDIIFATGESDNGRVHSGLVINGTQAGGVQPIMVESWACCYLQRVDTASHHKGHHGQRV
jgi:hypothetical protein